ncbi:MAG: helix-turn-helix transcriptional regulator [Gaiellaceae bacterium]
MLETPHSSPNVYDLLSPGELRVLELAAQGMTNARAAAHLGVTVHAIKFHLVSIYRKLGVSNRTAAAAMFLRSSLPDAATKD